MLIHKIERVLIMSAFQKGRTVADVAKLTGFSIRTINIRLRAWGYGPREFPREPLPGELREVVEYFQTVKDAAHATDRHHEEQGAHS